MVFSFNIFSLVLLISGSVAVFISAYIFVRSAGTGLRWFGFMISCISVWAITYGFELASTTLDQMLFWINLEYIGISLLPAFWIVFVFMFIGRADWLNLPNILFIFTFPVITLILVWTNQWHHLHYESVEVAQIDRYILLDIVAGPWYLVFTIYFYVMLAMGTFLIARKFRNAANIFRQQNSIIILAAFIPWLVNLLYLFGIRPYEHIDLTPYAFIITSFLLTIGLFRYNLLNIVPIARDKIIEELRSGVLVLDAYDRVVDLNNEMRRILGKEGVVVGTNFNKLFGSETTLLQRVSERVDSDIALQIVDRHFEVHITPLFEKNTVLSGAILLFRNITQQRLTEEKLAEQAKALKSLNQTKDKLFSVVAHDLRGPMVSLMQVMELMEDGTISAQEFRNYLPLFSKNLHSTYALLENLLVWSRSQMNGEKLILESFNLLDLIEEKREGWEATALTKNIKVISELSSLTQVYADREMIKIVLRNLVNNALKFTPENGTIKVSATQKEGTVQLCISDSGVGISEANQKKLFTGSQFTTVGTGNEKGTGLGLTLCKDFVEKNGGTIWVESELGKGSKFCFTLPAQNS